MHLILCVLRESRKALFIKLGSLSGNIRCYCAIKMNLINSSSQKFEFIKMGNTKCPPSFCIHDKTQ